MDVLKQGEHNPEEGRLFAYVYTADGDLFDTQRKAYDMFAGNNYFQCLKGNHVKMYYDTSVPTLFYFTCSMKTEVFILCYVTCTMIIEAGTLLTTPRYLTCIMITEVVSLLTTPCYLTCIMVTEVGSLLIRPCYLTCSMITEAGSLLTTP